ncbi:ATP-binding protein [Amycolatopsis sp. NPDC004772]
MDPAEAETLAIVVGNRDMTSAPSMGPVVVPRQLPGAVRDFTGRAEQVAALDAQLSGNDHRPAAAVVISAVDGTAGIGKTTLAVWWAHRVQHRFPDGTLYFNLSGYGPGDPAAPEEVLDGFLRALGLPGEAIPAGVEARAGLFRSLLAGRRMLLVLDNANSADQVRPLLPGSPGSVVVVTSRDSLNGLVVADGACRLTLDLLTYEESCALIAAVAGRKLADAEPGAVTDLVGLCARLPLALRIAASRIASAQATVGEVVADLADEHSRLDVLSRTGDERTAVRAVFDWSYRRLAPDQARMFRRLGLHAGPEVGVPAAAALCGCEPPQARRLLEELAIVHLIDPRPGGRFRFHDLLRTYAAEQVLRHDSRRERDQAAVHQLEWYAHNAVVCDEMVHQGQRKLPRPETLPSYPVAVPDRGSALEWLQAEQANLLAALDFAARCGWDRCAISLASATRFLGVRGLQEEREKAVAIGLGVAQRCGDRATEAWFFSERGMALAELHRFEEAKASCDRSFAIARERNDTTQCAWVLNLLALQCLAQMNFKEGKELLLKALPWTHNVDTGRMEAMVEGNLSSACTDLGQYEEAIRHGERNLLLRRQSGDKDGEAAAYFHLARAWHGLGDQRRTMAFCEDAINSARSGCYLTRGLSEALALRAECLLPLGRKAEALASWREALKIFEDYGEPRNAAAVRQRLRDL